MNLYAWSGVLGGISALTLPLLIFFNSDKENKKVTSLWVALNIGVALYSLGIIFGTTTADYENALLWWRVAYLGIPLIAPFYFHHAYKLARAEVGKKLLIIVYGTGVLYWLLNIAVPQFFIYELRWVFGAMWYPDFLSSNNIIANFSTMMFVAYFFALAIAANYKLFVAARSAEGDRRKQLYIFLIFGTIGFGGAGFFSYLPTFRIDVFPVLNFATTIYNVAVAYAVVRYGLYKAKVIAAEILTVILGLLFVVSLLGPKNAFLQVTVLVGFGILAFLLIRSSLSEVRLSAQLKDLNEHLEQKVAEQTVEIRHAYEVEKKARIELEELDKAKDQFILTTQHHLRTPLTIIKGYLSVLGDDRNLSDTSRSNLEKVFNSTETLSKFINDLLQITEVRIEGKDNKEKQ